MNASVFRKGEGSATDPKRILAPIDFSVASNEALSHVPRIAVQSDATIILLHVIEILPLQVALGLVPHEVKKENCELVRRGEAALTSLGEELVDSTVTVKPVVRVGVPYQVVVRVARGMAVDLIVIATHGYTGLTRMVLGSTAERVEHQPGQEAAQAGNEETLPPGQHRRNLLQASGVAGKGPENSLRCLPEQDGAESADAADHASPNQRGL